MSHGYLLNPNITALSQAAEFEDYINRHGQETIVVFLDMVDSVAYKSKRTFFQGLLKTLVHNRSATDSIQQHGGRIVKWIGDGVMARFRRQEASEAINTTIEILERFEEYNKNYKDTLEQIRTRVGVSVGKTIDFHPGDPQGQAVDIAARLEKLAKPNQILVNADLLKHIDVEKLRSKTMMSTNESPSNLIGKPEKQVLRGIGKVNVSEIRWKERFQGIGAELPRRYQSFVTFWKPLVAGNLTIITASEEREPVIKSQIFDFQGADAIEKDLRKVFKGALSRHVKRFSCDVAIKHKALLDNNLLLVGGPIPNEVTKDVFSRDRSIRYCFRRNTIVDRLDPQRKIRAKKRRRIVTEDYGILTKCRSPYNHKKSVVIASGCYGWGTYSALKALSLEYPGHLNYLSMIDQFFQILTSVVVSGRIPTEVMILKKSLKLIRYRTTSEPQEVRTG